MSILLLIRWLIKAKWCRNLAKIIKEGGSSLWAEGAR